jgi:hypothetical protein
VPGSGNPSGLLGYHYQLRHALDALWEVTRDSPDAQVQIEGIDDFEIAGIKDSVVQTKNHQEGSLTDRSKDLWKTLANWSLLELAGSLPLDAQLVLVTTAEASADSVAAALTVPNRSTTANRDIAARLDAIAAEESQSLRSALKAYRGLGDKQRVGLVARIRIMDGSPTLNQLGLDLQRHVRGTVPTNVVESVVREVEAWFVLKALGLMAEHKPAIIKAAEVARKTYELILAHGPEALPELHVAEWDGILPTDREFVKALAKISAHPTRQREAVRVAYLAQEHGLRWHRNALLREGEIEEYETKVRRKWALCAAQTLQKEPNPCPANEHEARGRELLLLAENDRSVPIRKTAPDFVQPGFTHLLADRKLIAWHISDVAAMLEEMK